MIAMFEKEGNKFQVDVEQLPAASVAYLIQYGFAQSMQDCIAGLAKAKRADLEATDDFKAGKLTPENIADEISLAILTQLEKRHKAIVEGTIGIRASAPRDELSSLAREQVRAALAKKGVKVEKEKLAELVAAHIEKNRDKLVAELERRKASQFDVELELA